jgi:hypothetical protein
MVAHTRGLFEPDTIVPSQFFATLRRQAPSNRGEYRLLVAVLEDAIDCFQENVHAANKSEQRLFDEAQGWITGEDGDTVSHADDQAPGFSFEYVCDVLGLDASYLRWGLQQWRTRTCAIADAQHAKSRPRAAPCERPL